MEYRIKRLRPDGIAAAIEKADKYRELNQPDEAESICRDVLAIDAAHQLGLRTLGLALTDRFAANTGARFAEAKAVFARLTDPYERAFYTGLAYERQAKAQLAVHLPIGAVRTLLDHALAHFDEAERLRPTGTDDPILRWNSCVRLLESLGATGEQDSGIEDSDPDFVPSRR